MIAVIRVDASIQIGSGHVMRCLTLANALRNRGCQSTFICRDLPGNLIDYIKGKGFEVNCLTYNDKLPKIRSHIRHSHWLGVPWEVDFQETKEILKNLSEKPDWLIVDHYSLDIDWEKSIRPYVKKILVIDDLADREHDCDILLDQNFSTEADYLQLVPVNCIKMLGPKYALLRPEYSKIRKNIREKEGIVRKILIFMGGTDPANITLKALKAVTMLEIKDLKVNVILGLNNPNKDQIYEFCKGLKNINIHCQVDNLFEFVAEADLAIGAAGSMTWERCCLGLPAVVLSVSYNQESIAVNAEKRGVHIYLGKAEDISVEKIGEALKNLIYEKNILKEMSRNGIELVDGFGVDRVLKEMGVSSYRISLLSDEDSWINKYIPVLITNIKRQGHNVRWIHNIRDVTKGDFAFFLGCGQIVPQETLELNKFNLVVHESDLPKGRGWSPLTWQILEGKNEITMTLFEAENKVDSGDIYIQTQVRFRGDELIEEMRRVQAEVSFNMCLRFLESYPDIIQNAKKQKGEPTYYPKRIPESSEIDPDKTVREQFNLLRVVDNERYPAFFYINGIKYVLKIEKG